MNRKHVNGQLDMADDIFFLINYHNLFTTSGTGVGKVPFLPPVIGPLI